MTATTNEDYWLHIVRNPHGHTDDQVRDARIHLANAFESLRRQVKAGQGEPVALPEFDAGLLNDFGGGNVEWWWGYIKHLLSNAHEHYQEVSGTPAPAIPNEWKEAVLDQCVVVHSAFYEGDPKKTLDTLIDWHVKIALDPLVCSDAQALIDKGEIQGFRKGAEYAFTTSGINVGMTVTDEEINAELSKEKP